MNNIETEIIKDYLEENNLECTVKEIMIFRSMYANKITECIENGILDKNLIKFLIYE